MLRNVFWKSLRDRRRAFLWWTAGMFGYILLSASVYPFVEEQGEQLAPLLENMPKEMLALFGVDNPNAIFTAAGYLNSRTFGWVVPVVFSLYAAALGARALGGEEESGTMDLLLANPVTRRRLAGEKFIAVSVVVLGLSAVLLASLLIWSAIFGLGIAADFFAAACLGAALLGLVFGSLALALNGWGMSRGGAMGVVSGVAVGSFLLSSLGSLADWLEVRRRLSPFFYYSASKPLLAGFDAANLAVLAVTAVALAAIGVWGFTRRDVGVG